MIHILSIIHYPIFGGPHNRNMRLAPFLANNGIKTTVVLPEEAGNCAQKLCNAGLDIVQLPLHRIRATHNPLEHLRFLSTFPAEVRSIYL